MDEIKAKQQVVEKIKESAKILVTVSDSPSVDALSAALALTMLLDKQEKYATSIFSGETPPAIAFLEPQKTFDDTTDSLRDFIIALNKEKADHLRYKVEGDSVKIFITPYKTTINEHDLEFSQGDYNVELVIALGVDKQEHLDKALEEHGQILHDAAIVTLSAGDQVSDLGGIDWHDGNASSLSEMVAGLAEAMKEDKKKSLLDETIATALLTGIVAETDRFSNEHTTSKVMTVAATLMSAGADQQLIANELQASHELPEPVEETPVEEDDTDSDVEIDKDSDDGSLTIKKEHDPSLISIKHDDDESLAELDRRVRGDEKAKELVVEEVEAAEERAAQDEAEEEAAAEPDPEPQPEPVEEPTEELVEQPEPAFEAPELDFEQTPIETPQAPVEEPVSAYAPVEETLPEPTPTPIISDVEVVPEVTSAYGPEETEEPTLGGTLNATTEQAAEDKRREAESDKNRTILSHSYLSAEQDGAPGQTSTMMGSDPAGFPGTPSIAPGSVGVNDVPAADDEVHSAYAMDYETQGETPGGSIGGERVIQPLSEAPAPAIQPSSAYAAPEPTPVAPATPTDLGLPLPPPIPDFSQINGSAAPAIPLPPTEQPAILGDILAPEAPQQSFDTTNAVPAVNSAYAPEAGVPSLPPLSPSSPDQPQPVQPFAPTSVQPAPSADPGQFQIPSQQ